jgi:hypothetical protein
MQKLRSAVRASSIFREAKQLRKIFWSCVCTPDGEYISRVLMKVGCQPCHARAQGAEQSFIAALSKRCTSNIILERLYSFKTNAKRMKKKIVLLILGGLFYVAAYSQTGPETYVWPKIHR